MVVFASTISFAVACLIMVIVVSSISARAPLTVLPVMFAIFLIQLFLLIASSVPPASCWKRCAFLCILKYCFTVTSAFQ